MIAVIAFLLLKLCLAWFFCVLMQKVLVDSNIFLDYYLDRQDAMLPLGEFAFQFVEKTLKRGLINPLLQIICLHKMPQIAKLSDSILKTRG